MSAPFEEATMSGAEFAKRHGTSGDGQQKPNGQAPEPAASADLEPKRTDWMWHPRLPAGMISIIGARGGGCKGLTCMSLTASVTTGRAWPDGSPQASPAQCSGARRKTRCPRWWCRG